MGTAADVYTVTNPWLEEAGHRLVGSIRIKWVIVRADFLPYLRAASASVLKKTESTKPRMPERQHSEKRSEGGGKEDERGVGWAGGKKRQRLRPTRLSRKPRPW